VTFGADVVVLGDGPTEPGVIAGDKLEKQAELVRIGASSRLTQGISESHDALSKAIWGLSPNVSQQRVITLLFDHMFDLFVLIV
jgi:hypothetical protein